MQLIQANNVNKIDDVDWPLAAAIKKAHIIPISHWRVKEKYTVAKLWIPVSDKDDKVIKLVTDIVMCAC